VALPRNTHENSLTRDAVRRNEGVGDQRQTAGLKVASVWRYELDAQPEVPW
jgi:hypothetical protein